MSVSSARQGGDSVSVYEALSLIIAFGTLIAVIVLSR
ncbi:putative holin-like toxin [Phascolarctobacterium sp.]